MKKNTKNLFFGIGLSLLSGLAFAQDGLEKIIVEKYYIANAADTAGSVGKLPIGSVTYRVYADMLPGYKFQALYGNSDHPLKVNTSTSFFNNEDRGAKTPNGIASSYLKNNTVALDSWFSVGASATGQFGVLKSEDDGKANLLTLNSLLKNNAAAMGIPLTTQDGNMAGTPEAVTLIGFSTELDIFDATSLAGNSLTTTNAAISALNGATGPTASNRVLLGQFTTDGILSFEFNIQIGTPTPGVSQKYVARNPLAGEKSIPSLIYVTNLLPETAITSPANNAKFITGDSVNVTANASDKDGTIKKVEFLVDGVKFGTDSIAPYASKFKTLIGNHTLTTIAFDNVGDSTISAPISISAADNVAPTVQVSVEGKAMTGDKVALNATATDTDGTVKKVEFFVDNVSVGVDSVSPYTLNWTATVGTHKVKAIATDNLNATTTSNEATIVVSDNVAPTVQVSVAGTAITGDKVALNATATDTDGTVKKVEFFVDNVSVGVDSVSPYTLNWTATVGTHKVKAVATDNLNATTTSNEATIIVTDNVAPKLTLSADTTAIKDANVTINATATDSDGTVKKVEFFIDNVSIGVDSIAPYSIVWKATTGTHTIKAIATDNKGATTTVESSIKVKDSNAGILTIDDSKVISVYPNPAVTFVNVISNQNATIQITNISGQEVVFKGELNANEKQIINVAHFANGVYLVNVFNTNFNTVQRIVVNN